ncbi:response regulator transcription factor [Clostridium estertheticum]|uniref:response regulator transcription factor n=1 Tax=Clostridium estertheticum TaxID=238834 RepID=UPI001C7CBF53|nr:response regulator [Clostridium estertheticum]MBX4269697.1 response regulator [Clostridium estertheticum]WLC77879.1 response regulator [Clostridium estertheticum]
MHNLLIVEDENIERRALRYIIEDKLSCINICGEAKSGLEAIEMAKTSTPDIILMDVEMPELSGLEAQKEIIKFLPDVHTIILSAYDDFTFTQSAIRIKVIDYLLKPIRPNDLIESINRSISLINTQNDRVISDSQDDTLIKEAMHYIDEHYNTYISLQSIAAYVHLNPQYFSRYFKSKIGINFINYLSSFRVIKAKDLLLNTDKNITEISQNVGYVDSSYFSKVFLKSVGMSPNHFRCQNKKQHF